MGNAMGGAYRGTRRRAWPESKRKGGAADAPARAARRPVAPPRTTQSIPDAPRASPFHRRPCSRTAPGLTLSPMRWRVLLTPPLPGADNMALDEALLERARDSGEAVARVYTWSRPTLSLGRNQTAAGRYDLALAAALGIDVVRRPTGGRAVLHHRELTYAVAAPTG